MNHFLQLPEYTHGSQHYGFLGQANLYRLSGLWQMPRQIWTISFWTGTKSYNGRGRFQPTYAIEESAGPCSRKLC